MAAKKAEMAPTQAITCNTTLSVRYTGYNLATRYTPATTMVAACINADTGVGPSMASGSQMCKGNMALFPAPPINTNVRAHVKTDTPKNEVEATASHCDEFVSVSLSIIVLKSRLCASN